MSSYKCCAVPMCKSTTVRCPNKLFIHVPKCDKRRKQWIMLARRNPDVTSKNATIYFCEDHFDLPHDMENYMEYKIMGSISQIRMKRNCLPSKFECQADRQKIMARKPHTEHRSVEIDRQQSYTAGILKSILEDSKCHNKPYRPKFTKMTDSCNDSVERLFLWKSDVEEISVPCNELDQHQIDGIRFLFKQYKQMKQGVIINYVSGYEASAQVALFISAIQTDLEKPVLILYDDGKEKRKWLETFSKLTSIGADSIVFDAPNPFIKKLVYISDIANIDKLSGRQWSIVIVKSDEVAHKFMRYSLKVNFKIWITSVDMKKYTTTLNVIYSWMYDKSKAEINKYLDHKTDVKESFNNILLLDYLLKDVLLTRKELIPFPAPKHLNKSELKVKSKVSRKNKDATGMKIKRTKKTIDAPTTLLARSQDIDNNQAITQQSPSIKNDYEIEETKLVFESNNIKIDYEDEDTKSDVESNSIKIGNEDEETKSDVESFIRDNKPLGSDSNLSITVRNLDYAAHTSLPVSPKVENASCDSFVEFRSSMEKNYNNRSSKLSAEFIKNTSQESIVVDNEIKLEEIEAEFENKSDSSNLLIIQTDSKSSQNSQSLYLQFSNGFSQEPLAVAQEEVIETDRECDTTYLMPKIEQVFSLGLVKNESSNEEGGQAVVKMETEVSSVASIEVIGDQENKLELTTRVTQETENNFDLKMRQMEERALKKFKGSFLDNMFKL